MELLCDLVSQSYSVGSENRWALNSRPTLQWGWCELVIQGAVELEARSLNSTFENSLFFLPLYLFSFFAFSTFKCLLQVLHVNSPLFLSPQKMNLTSWWERLLLNSMMTGMTRLLEVASRHHLLAVIPIPVLQWGYLSLIWTHKVQRTTGCSMPCW